MVSRRWFSLLAACVCEFAVGALYAVGLYLPYLQARFGLSLGEVQVCAN